MKDMTGNGVGGLEAGHAVGRVWGESRTAVGRTSRQSCAYNTNSGILFLSELIQLRVLVVLPSNISSQKVKKCNKLY